MVLARPAVAHTGGDPAVRLVLDDPPAVLDGMTVQVVDRLTPQLVLANPTDRVVEVLDDEGRPFLRIGPDGVEGNLAVPAWSTTNDPAGATRLPEDVGGPDRWGRVAEEPSWGWYDHRLHPGPLRVPPALVGTGQPARIGTWAVPIEVDGMPAELTGEVRYEPVRGVAVAALDVRPDVAGLEVAVLPGGVPGLFVRHDGDRPVTLLGAAGEPFLRFDPDGGVQANLRSPSWLDSARAADGTAPEEAVDPAAEPRWAPVAATPAFSWVDPRLALPDRQPPEAVAAAAEPAELGRWTVPVLVEGGTTTEIGGRISWQPDPALAERAADRGAGGRWAAVAGVGVLAAAAAAWQVRRQRPRRRRPGTA